ncbi:MgtC/SapB family protein (plasmid) [Aneurinibacillus sp. Ricciae_BoGa-3]|uniref:MgtC/SapB family protein n=1 Tax=Aneurinibacillus sp. Ricciae_BoGa-3 TaxID=3022697 RepID=UPI002342501A|nr:MgtC/SapB family protein [Aneurinibacillus sp. Ricciae_BoGa-3]WCK57148.1 MgtC/SapB family protein [Aneurinibacillus sp. Ricciae_BoGa-3]
MSIETEFIRMFLAFLLGGAIGWQRESYHKPAGIRTHILVCLGSCLTMMMGVYLSESYHNVDPTRISAQVISGLGFIGAGTILKNGLSVTGLTTASSIWLVGCVGLAVGCGFYMGAVGVTLMCFLSLSKFKRSSKEKDEHNLENDDKQEKEE